MTFHKQLFNRQTFRVGWSVCWRIWAATIGLRIVFTLPVAFWYSFHRAAAAQDPSSIRLQFEQISGLGNIPTLIALIPVMSWIGKSVLRKRGLPVSSRFIGWTLLWRGGGLAVLLGLGSVVVLVLPVAWITPKLATIFAAPLIAMLMFASSLFSFGWATLRVSRMATPETETID